MSVAAPSSSTPPSGLDRAASRSGGSEAGDSGSGVIEFFRSWARSGWNFARNWARWVRGWTKHGLVVGAQRMRVPLKKTPLLVPRIGRLYQHKPRPLRIPSRYATTAAPSITPRISIVTPSFKQAHLIERTIRSVLDQGYPNLEYIIQDGGSTDGTREILERYSDRLHHWESVRDNGQTDAINRGFKHATGEIMAYLNSDDLLLPGTLNCIAQYFEEHPEVDAVYGHRVLIDDQDREIGRWILPSHDDRVLSWADYIPQETLFWRRSAWDRVGGRFDESFHFAMDWDFLLRLRDAGVKFVRLPRFLGAFRVHDAQKTSAVISDVGMQEMTRLRQRTLGYVPEAAEVHVNCSRYLLRHLGCHAMYRAGLARY